MIDSAPDAFREARRRVVAIDGPSGSGKSTIARGVAEALGMQMLDTGAMYRAVTCAVLRAHADPTDQELVTTIAQAVHLDVTRGVTTLDGEDVSAVIRGPEVTANVSSVSVHPGVRAEMVARQRTWVAHHGGGVVEGRDIGSVVFPDAPVKVYLVASHEERARRRQHDETAADRSVSLEEVQHTMAQRDTADSTRAVSPLRSAEGAMIIDTTGRTPEAIVAEIVQAFEHAEGAD